MLEYWDSSTPKLHNSITPFLASVNAKQLERPALQAGPSRCESDHGCHDSHRENKLHAPVVRVAQIDKIAALRRRRSQVQFLPWTPFPRIVV